MRQPKETEDLGLDLEEFDASSRDPEEDGPDREAVELDFDGLE